MKPPRILTDEEIQEAKALPIIKLLRVEESWPHGEGGYFGQENKHGNGN